jgi:microcystin-dependent protein
VYSGTMSSTAIASGSTGTSSSGVSLNDIAAENGDPHVNVMPSLVLNFIIKY